MNRLIGIFNLVLCTGVFLMGAQPVVQAQPCNPYRLGYEKAIAQGIIKRAPLVKGPKDAYQHFQVALENGDRIEAAVRAVQYLVIVSESNTPNMADLERLELENFIVNHFHKPVEVSVPMLAVILPSNLFCPVANATP